MAIRLLTTLLAASCGAYLGVRQKIPAGAYIGAAVCTGAFQLITGLAWFPAWMKTICSIFIGSYIGTKIRREDLHALRGIPAGTAVMILGLIIYQGLAALCMIACTEQSPLDLLLGLAPGGASELSIIALDLGADVAVVSTLQIIRLLIVVALTPLLAKRIILRRRKDEASPSQGPQAGIAAPPSKQLWLLPVTLAYGTVGGCIGKLSGLPGGTLCGAILLVAAVNLWRGNLYIPPVLKHGAAACSGILSGIQLSMAELAALQAALPMIIGIDLGWIAVSLAIGMLLTKHFGFSMETALFSSIPGGMSDMGLAAEEMGGNTIVVTSVQSCRMVAVLITTPVLAKMISK